MLYTICENQEQMPTLIRMDGVVVEDYYDMATMDENVKGMKQTHLLSNCPLNRRAPLVHLRLLQSS
jgi:hypothetical protein